MIHVGTERALAFASLGSFVAGIGAARVNLLAGLVAVGLVHALALWRLPHAETVATEWREEYGGGEET